MIEELQTWKDELENLPKVADTSWAANFAGWYADMIAGIEPDTTALTAVGWSFTFQEAIFVTNLMLLGATLDPASGILGFADAWLAAMQASIAVTAPGTDILPSAPPATVFSVVTTTTIDPPSMAAAKLKLLELVSAPVAEDAQDSEFPIKFREATLLLTITIVGLDSTPPGSGGPLPLTAAAIPLI